MAQDMLKNIWNFISTNIGWFACILGAARGYPWIGLIVVLILFIIHIVFIENQNARNIIIIACISMVIGIIADTFIIAVGNINLNRWIIPPPFTTIWDLTIWANFSLTLNTSLRFLQKKLLIAAFLGAIFAPGTYYAGERLGALNFTEPHWKGIVWIGVVWILVMPLLSLLAKKCNNRNETKKI